MHRDRRIARRSIVQWLTVACSTVLVSATASAACQPAENHEIRNFINSQGEGTAHISIRPSDFTLANLLCLTEDLEKQHNDWKKVVLLFFSSDEAAQNFDASGMSDGRVAARRCLRNHDRRQRQDASIADFKTAVRLPTDG